MLADELGQLGVPVYLYGELAGGRTRAELRKDLTPFAPDFGPPTHPTAGATLVAARPPLVAFNVEIDASLQTAKEIAHDPAHHARRARARACRPNTSRSRPTSRTAARWREVVEAVRAHASVTGAELVAPAPRAAFADFPDDVPLRAPKPLEDHLLS